MLALTIRKVDFFPKITTGKDVALWKPTNQSSTYSERILNKWVYFTSDKAVDGSGDGNFDNLSCTHTAAGHSKRPSWNVNLGKAYSIIAIKIANRNDNRKYATHLFHIVHIKVQRISPSSWYYKE